MPVAVRPLADGIGAEVLSFDASEPVSVSDQVAIREALFDHLILVFRAQRLSIEQQIRFTGIFGTVEVSPDTRNAHPVDSRILIVSNAQAGKTPRPSSSRYWHTDRSFVDKPSMTTLLHVLQVPARGGDTLYADMRKAYELLSAATKARLEGLRARHSYQESLEWLRRQQPWTARRALETAGSRIGRVVHRMGARLRSAGALRSSTRFPDVVHPLVRPHPVTGQKALYLNEVCVTCVEGLGEKESGPLLRELYDHALQPRFIYRHKWRPGDLVVWDNPSLMHRATDTPPECPRLLHRSTAAEA
jgi:taurine dioxygenase